MDDMLKKVINTGVGLLAQGNKRVQTALDKLVQESKLSEQEGQKIMDDLRKSGEAKRKQFEKQVQDLAGSLRERVGLAPDEKAAAEPEAPKAKAAPTAAAKKPARSSAAKAAGAVKQAADKVSDAAAKTQRSAATKAGAAKKAAEKAAD